MVVVFVMMKFWQDTNNISESLFVSCQNAIITTADLCDAKRNHHITE